MEELLQIARRFAEDFRNAKVEPAHLLRACLHPEMGLVDYLESTLAKDYYYFVEWAEAQISMAEKSTCSSDLPLSESSEAVLREAKQWAAEYGMEKVDALCVLAVLTIPGVGFSFEQLKTLPLTADEISCQISHQHPAGKIPSSPDVAAGPAKQKFLKKYCTFLNDTVYNNNINIIGFEKEISTLYEVLGRKSKANVLVTGESGVGKTSLIRRFVQSLMSDQLPEHLKHASLYELHLDELTAGASYKGEVEDRAKGVLSELSQTEGAILVIESVDKLFDKQDMLYGIVSLLKQHIDKGDFSLLCSSTMDGYTKHIENDKEFSHKVERVMVEPPSVEQCFRIVKGSIGGYERFHGLKVTDEVIREAIRLAQRYMTERPLPDSVFDLLDRTMSQIGIMNGMAEADISAFRKRLSESESQNSWSAAELSWLHYEIFHKISCLLIMQMEDHGDFDACETADGKIQYLHQVLDELEKMVVQKRTEVLSADLSAVVAKITGIPMGKVQTKERDKLANGEEILKRRVIGQDHAIKVVLDAVYESRSGLNKKGQPMGSFFFLGPTGTGKTELSKSLVEFLFGDEKALIRFDMSEFKEEHSVALLYGAPPGYVGYEEGGLLVNKIRQNPYAVVLFDEIEKAHKSVFDLFLQILDEGKLHDRLGRVGDFSNALILFTSNIGSQFISEAFGKGHIPQNNELMELMQGHFRPEFLGRLTEIVPFAPISEQTVVRIFDIHLRNLCKQLEEQHITLIVDEECKRSIAMNGFDPQYGARPIIGIIRKELRRPLATKIINGSIKSGDTVHVVWQDGAPVFQVEG